MKRWIHRQSDNVLADNIPVAHPSVLDDLNKLSDVELMVVNKCIPLLGSVWDVGETYRDNHIVSFWERYTPDEGDQMINDAKQLLKREGLLDKVSRFENFYSSHEADGTTNRIAIIFKKSAQ